MRVVVIGATGNVGTSLLAALADDPAVDEIVGVARRAPAGEWRKTTWATADIRGSDLVPVLRGADAVVHLGWVIQPSRDRAETRSINYDGTLRVFRAVADAGVPALVYASSVGAYSPGPKDRAVDESWPTGGVSTSFYSRDKSDTERALDRFEAEHPEVRAVRLRPGLIFKREAAAEIRRYFAGPLLPSPLVRRSLIPVVPRIPRLRFQAVHSDDVAQAYRRAILDADAHGAYNVAAEPVLDPETLARLVGARLVPVPAGVVRAAAAVTWRLRLQPTPPGWLDMALGVPIMDTSRAREQLGWAPRRTSGQALLELIEGLREDAGAPTPPLDGDAGGPLRSRELLSGVGARND